MLVDGITLGTWGPYACALRIWGRFGHPELKGVPGQRLIAAVQPLPLGGRVFERPRQASKRLNSSETLRWVLVCLCAGSLCTSRTM